MTTERSLGDYHPCKLRKSSLKCEENQTKDDKENCEVTKGNWKKKQLLQNPNNLVPRGPVERYFELQHCKGFVINTHVQKYTYIEACSILSKSFYFSFKE